MGAFPTMRFLYFSFLGLTVLILLGVPIMGVPKSRNLSNLGSFCRYVAQGSPPQIWGPSDPLWGRYEFSKFRPVFQRANHDLALVDIFSKIKNIFCVVVWRSLRGLRVAKKNLGLPLINLGDMALWIFFRTYLNGQNFWCCYTAIFKFRPEINSPWVDLS